MGFVYTCRRFTLIKYIFVRFRILVYKVRFNNAATATNLFRNGLYASAPLIAKLCGKNITVPEIISHTQHLYLKLVTNRSGARRGFKAYWNQATTGGSKDDILGLLKSGNKMLVKGGP